MAALRLAARLTTTGSGHGTSNGGGPFLSTSSSTLTAASSALSSVLQSPASSIASGPTASIADIDDDALLLGSSLPSTPVLQPQQPHGAATTTRAVHPATCDSCSEIETEFAAAVLFVESYHGPHRILTQESSGPKKDFYAFYQQATVGPCPGTPPSTSLSKLDLAKREKWKALGQMTRHEAMRRYTMTLDNLVDDWRRSKTVRDTLVHVHSNNETHSEAQKPMSMFDRLPKVFEDVNELQHRLEEETKRREELENHLLGLTRENHALYSRETRQMDLMRSQLTALVKTCDARVTEHYNELQELSVCQQELQERLDDSMLFVIEFYARRGVQIVLEWTRNKNFRRFLLVLLFYRVWRLLKRQRMPAFIAQSLIRFIKFLSSPENTSPPALQDK